MDSKTFKTSSSPANSRPPNCFNDGNLLSFIRLFTIKTARAKNRIPEKFESKLSLIRDGFILIQCFESYFFIDFKYRSTDRPAFPPSPAAVTTCIPPQTQSPAAKIPDIFVI